MYIVPPLGTPPPTDGLRKLSKLWRAGVDVPLWADIEGWREMVVLPVPPVAAAARSNDA